MFRCCYLGLVNTFDSMLIKQLYIDTDSVCCHVTLLSKNIFPNWSAAQRTPSVLLGLGTAGAGERPACIDDIHQNVTCTSSAIDLLLDALQQWEAPALGLGIDLSVAASACDPGQFCMQQHARSIAFMHASWLVQSPCLSFSNCGTHTHTGIEEAAGISARAHTQTRECTAQR